MTLILDFLSRKPGIGLLSSLGTSAISLIDDILPWCQLAGIIIGLAVGILTVIAKLLEIKKLKNHQKNNSHD